MNHTPKPWVAVVQDNRVVIWRRQITGGTTELVPVAEIVGDLDKTPEALPDGQLMAAAPDLLDALRQLAHIASYYHKGEAPGDLDACENPDNCGHCLAMRATRAALAKVGL